jgi:hypothetical protein
MQPRIGSTPLPAILGALALAAAAPAEAAIITTTYVGVISAASAPAGASGYDFYDTYGLWGPAGANLSGDAVTVTYTTNDALYPYGGYGGIYGYATSGDVSINGVSLPFFGANGFTYLDGLHGFFSQAGGFYSPPVDGLADAVVNTSVEATTDFLSSPDFHDSFSQSCTPGSCVGYGYLALTQSFFPLNFIEIPIDITSISNSSAGVPTPPAPPPPPGTPEPSTWAMLTLGSLAVGAALRRRKAEARYSGADNVATDHKRDA